MDMSCNQEEQIVTGKDKMNTHILIHSKICSQIVTKLQLALQTVQSFARAWLTFVGNECCASTNRPSASSPCWIFPVHARVQQQRNVWGTNTNLISVRFHIHCPLVGVSIFFSLLAEVARDIAVDNWLDYCNTLRGKEKMAVFFHKLVEKK